MNIKYTTTLCGKVISSYKNIALKPRITNQGYIRVVVYKDKIPKEKSVHRLVAQEYLPNPENKPQVNHKNGIKCDNRVCNLEWVTASENKIHSLKLGLSKSGENHHKSKLTKEQALLIREDKRPNKEIVREYNMSLSNICRIKKGILWNY
jgi:hypothetical protein